MVNTVIVKASKNYSEKTFIKFSLLNRKTKETLNKSYLRTFSVNQHFLKSQIYSEKYRKKNFFPKNSTKMISTI